MNSFRRISGLPAVRLVLIGAMFLARQAQSGVHSVSPGESVQAALRKASPGDVVELADGVYFETLVIDKPIALRARHGGRATISNAHPAPVTFVPTDGTKGLFRADVPWPVHWVMVGDRNLYDYRTPANLATFTMDPAYCRLDEPAPGFPEGFAWDDGTLYLRLERNEDPNHAAVEINSSRMNGRSRFLKNNGLDAMAEFERPWSGPLVLPYADRVKEIHLPPSFGVLVSVRAEGVTIEGLRLHFAPHVAIDIEDSWDTTIRDCYFDGFQHAINTWAESGNLTVENCEFSGGRVYERHGRMGFTWTSWSGLYFSNLSCDMVLQRGPGFVFRQNYLYEGFDGIQPRGVDESRAAAGRGRPSEISFNVVLNFCDNNLELDGWTRLLNLRVHHNLVVNGESLLSCAPVQRGPLTVDHNIFHQDRDAGPSSGWAIKLGQPMSRLAVNRGLRVVHNTFHLPGKRLVWGYSSPECAYEDNLIENNLFIVDDEYWPRGLPRGPHNVVRRSADGVLAATMPVDFRLAPGSAGVATAGDLDGVDLNGSIRGNDVGAIEFGAEWEFPRPGPRWAVDAEMPQRPAWPPSINPDWAGLGDGGGPRSAVVNRPSVRRSPASDPLR